jgi:hypothetical protein
MWIRRMLVRKWLWSVHRLLITENEMINVEITLGDKTTSLDMDMTMDSALFCK